MEDETTTSDEPTPEELEAKAAELERKVAIAEAMERIARAEEALARSEASMGRLEATNEKDEEPDPVEIAERIMAEDDDEGAEALATRILEGEGRPCRSSDSEK